MANVLNYVEYDFDQAVQQLQDRLKNKGTWQDIYRSSTGEMLIELLAYVLNQGMYYTERRANESYIGTAQLRSSIVNLVQLLNYVPKRKTSSTGSLTFSISSPLTKIVYIPKYTECQSAEGIKFLTNEDAAIEKGQTSVAVNCIQGELIQSQVTSDGSTEQEITLTSTNVENSASTTNPTLRVTIDGTTWTKVASFIYSTNINQHYRIINEMDGYVTIKFGDNINGAAPSSGSVITVQYVKSDGADGNVTFPNKITTVNSAIYDEDGATVTVSVTNSGSFLGGDDEEDIEEIRYEAPRVFKTGDRAVSKTDFIAIIENYAGVANANVWGENEEALAAGVAAVQSMLNKVKMCIILQNWELPDDSFKSTLSAYIYNKSMITVKYEFVTPTILYVIPTLIVKVTAGESLSQAQADIDEAVEEKFVLGTTTKLGTIIKYSDIISAIHDLDNVAYVNMTLEIKKALSDTYDSTYDYGEELEATDIKPETVRLFIDGSYVTTDSDNGDGTGSFSATGTHTVSGTVNYSTGVINVDISPTPTQSVHVRYQQDENGNIVPTFTEICKLEEVDITSISMESS